MQLLLNCFFLAGLVGLAGLRLFWMVVAVVAIDGCLVGFLFCGRLSLLMVVWLVCCVVVAIAVVT